MARPVKNAARVPKPMRRASPAEKPAPAESAERRGSGWPVWTALVLAVLYLLAHRKMLPAALDMWGGLLSALVLGR